MTPLSDALAAAQRRALTALEKAYVGDLIERDDLEAKLDAMALGDVYDRQLLLATLDVLREWGAPVPAEQNGAPKEEPMSDKQAGFINDLCERHSLRTPELAGLTKAQASDLINELQAGSYDPEKWTVPF